VILRFNFEELSALRAGAEGFLRGGDPSSSAVLAPTAERVRVEALAAMLDGDLSLGSLAEARWIRGAVEAIVQWFKSGMDARVLTAHPADEVAVAYYFDYAHALTVANRVSRIEDEMSAMVELITGEPPTPESAREIRFPD